MVQRERLGCLSKNNLCEISVGAHRVDCMAGRDILAQGGPKQELAAADRGARRNDWNGNMNMRLCSVSSG